MNPTSPHAQAHHNAGSSERDAQRRASYIAGSLRSRLLAAVVAAGDMGLTVPEALEGLNLPERKRYSVAPRFPELLREGFVSKGEIRADHVSYVATAAARAWAESEVAA